MRSRSLSHVCIAWLCVLACPLWLRAAEVPQTRAEFLKLIDRPRVPLDPKLDDPVEIEDGMHQAHFTFTSEADVRVPGIVIHPAAAGAKMPCVICLHGTGGKKENELGVMKKLAQRGCIAVAIDGRWHGERLKDLPGTDHYNQTILKRFKGEVTSFPLYWDTVWDLMRLIDLVSQRDEVDAERIGMIGFSKGGIETYFTAAADPRVACAVPCIGAQSFHWGLENDGWHGRVNTVKSAFLAAAKLSNVEKPDAAFAKLFMDKVVPGIDSRFDGTEMIPLIAPRPLLLINGDTDGNTPLPGVTLVDEKTKAAYEKVNAGERFQQIIEPHTGHKVTDENLTVAIDFLGKWLKFER